MILNDVLWRSINLILSTSRWCQHKICVALHCRPHCRATLWGSQCETTAINASITAKFWRRFDQRWYDLTLYFKSMVPFFKWVIRPWKVLSTIPSPVCLLNAPLFIVCVENDCQRTITTVWPLTVSLYHCFTVSPFIFYPLTTPSSPCEFFPYHRIPSGFSLHHRSAPPSTVWLLTAPPINVSFLSASRPPSAFLLYHLLPSGCSLLYHHRLFPHLTTVYLLYSYRTTVYRVPSHRTTKTLLPSHRTAIHLPKILSIYISVFYIPSIPPGSWVQHRDVCPPLLSAFASPPASIFWIL